jgi:hypothetical protein
MQPGTGMFGAGGFQPGRPIGGVGGGFQTVLQNRRALLPAAAIAGMNLLGDAPMEEKLTRAATTMAGGVIGTLTGAGPVIGAAIGDAAGAAMIAAIKGAKLDITPVAELDTDQMEEAYQRVQKQLFREIAPAGEFTKLFGDEKQWNEIAEKAYETFKESGIQKAIDEIDIATEGRTLKDALGYGEEDLERLFARRQELERAMFEKTGTTPGAEDALKRFHKERYDEIAKFNQQVLLNTAEMSKKRRAELEKYVTGDITRKEYSDFVKGQEDAINRVGTLYRELSGAVDDPLDKMTDKFARMSEETRDELISLVTQINTLEDALVTAGTISPEDVPKTKREIEELKNALAELYKLAQTQGQEPFKFRGFSDYSDYTQAEFDEIINKAKELQDSYFEYLGIPEEVWKEAIDAWVAYNKEGFDEVSDVYQQFVQMVKARMDEAKKASETFNLQRLKDVSPDKIPELNRLVRYWETTLSSVPGYAEQAESQPFNLLFGEENVAHRLITTQEALRFAIEDLTEVEKKQLEGMWNIPEGATVMVPLQSLYYAPKGGGGLQVPETPGATFGGAGELGLGGEFDAPANKMDTAADKMLQASEMQSQQKYTMWEKAKEAFPEGFGPEESMWGKAKRLWPEGGFGPRLSEEGAAEKKLLDAVDPMRGMEDFIDGRQIGSDMATTFQPTIDVKVPDIVANITMNIPSIILDGRKVSEALRVNQTSRLTSEARTRGAAGGGVIQ